MKSRTLVSLIGSACIAYFLAQAGALAQGVTPGPEHDRLKQLQGEWTAKIKMGGEESEGKVTYKMGLGGLWLLSDFQAEFGGQEFKGHGMDGYDPEKGKFVSVWVDSWTPRPMVLEGTYDKAKKTLTMVGEALGPDGKMAKHRFVTHMPDNDHQNVTVYVTGPDGQEIEAFSIQYTRKK